MYTAILGLILWVNHYDTRSKRYLSKASAEEEAAFRAAK